MNKWDIRFLQLAAFVATWSKDPSTQIGCVIANDTNQVVAMGYNGFPRGASDDHRLNIREQKYKMVIHAEENAIVNATGSLKDTTAFVTHSPCLHCAGMLKQVGIKRVVFEEPSLEWRQRWSPEETVAYLKELGISCMGYRRSA